MSKIINEDNQENHVIRRLENIKLISDEVLRMPSDTINEQIEYMREAIKIAEMMNRVV